MSLTDTIVEELYAIEPNKTCCRKALLCGLLYSHASSDKQGKLSASFYRETDAIRAARLIDTGFGSGEQARIEQCSRGGHKAFLLCFSSKAVSGIFADIDDGRSDSIASAVGFRCRDCEGHFLKGVFASCASLGNPKSGYHLEFSLPDERRAALLSDILTQNVAKPGIVKRGARVGLYYKSNVKIADVLYFFGATKSSFEMTNMSIERDIRNHENRATNCVTRNISRSVDAAAKHVEAINYLISIGKLELLSEELSATARLRVEYASATLTELAMLHTPPITKSGLNGRLSRILAIAEEQKRLAAEKENNN